MLRQMSSGMSASDVSSSPLVAGQLTGGRACENDCGVCSGVAASASARAAVAAESRSWSSWASSAR
jgi:hypothetical protein